MFNSRQLLILIQPPTLVNIMKSISFFMFLFIFASCNIKKHNDATAPLENSDSSKDIVIYGDKSILLKAINEKDSLLDYGPFSFRFFLFMPSHPNVLFRLVRNDNTIILTTKLFNYIWVNSSGYYKLIDEKQMVLSEKDAYLIEMKIYDAMFWNLKSDLNQCVLDGTCWDIEGYSYGSQFNHIALVTRKRGPLNEIYEILIKNSGLNYKMNE
jgi:hypothetical protein